MIDPCTRDYVMDENGKPVIDEGLKTPAYFRLKIPRNAWLYAPDDNFGSDFHLIRKNITSSNQVTLINISDRALEPLIEEDRAIETETTFAERARHGVGLNISIRETAKGEDDTMFVPIGERL